MNLWHDIKAKNNNTFNAIIEIPSGSINKYEIDKETGVFSLEQSLLSTQAFPFDYGFIPQTLGGDGDPLDIIVLNSNPLIPGCLVKVKPIKVMRMIDDDEVDDKIIAISINDYYWKDKNNLNNINFKLEEIKNWFKIYKQINGTKLEILGFDNFEKTIVIIEKSIEMYQDKFNK